MEIKYSKDKIVLPEKKLNNLDIFVLDFIKILKKHAKYVIVSGYVSILFGRSRATEDIDIIVEKKDLSNFFKTLEKKGYWLINAQIDEVDEIMKEGAVRIAKKGKIIPNVEIKFVKTSIEELALKNRVELSFGKTKIYISPIELQVVYKLFLGSEKDIEDARHLFRLLVDYLDLSMINNLVKDLKVEKKLKLLGDFYDRLEGVKKNEKKKF
jgi:hypothetical protein